MRLRKEVVLRILLLLLPPALLLLAWRWIGGFGYLGVRWLLDTGDIHVYFESSRWAIGQGRLFSDVFSEYPLIANLAFAFVRVLSHALPVLSGGESSFAWYWVALMWVLFASLATHLGRTKTLCLVPGALYFSLFRYDLLPVAFSAFSLLYFQRRRFNQGFLLLGISLALKGYALAAVPVFFYYCVKNTNLKQACLGLVLCMLPFLLSNLVVLSYAGIAGMLMPYAFHAARDFNGESLWDSLSHLLTALDVAPERSRQLRELLRASRLPQLLQLGSGLLVLALRPRDFATLCRATCLALVGFITFSVFISPQWILWFFAPLVFFRGRIPLAIMFVFSLHAYVYYPVGYDLMYHGHPELFPWIVDTGTVLRLALIGLLWFRQLPISPSGPCPVSPA